MDILNCWMIYRGTGQLGKLVQHVEVGRQPDGDGAGQGLYSWASVTSISLFLLFLVLCICTYGTVGHHGFCFSLILFPSADRRWWVR